MSLQYMVLTAYQFMCSLPMREILTIVDICAHLRDAAGNNACSHLSFRRSNSIRRGCAFDSKVNLYNKGIALKLLANI